MSGPQIVMIADDLSGAADSAATCAVQGLSTIVQLSEISTEPAAQLISIDAATRSMPADNASATIERLTAANGNGRILFKKVDSLLRGHVGTELAAMLRVEKSAVAVMAPALPAQGRTTLEGWQCLNGERLADKEIPHMMHAAGLICATVGIDLVRGEPASLLKKMSSLSSEHNIVVCDAETEKDLQAIAKATAALPQKTIWAGTAGLARYMPAALGVEGKPAVEELPRFRGPILMAIGSRKSLTREQTSEAECLGSFTTLNLAPDVLAAGCTTTQWIEQSFALSLALEKGEDVIVRIECDEDRPEDSGPCMALASLLAPHIRNIGALIATGGETARAILLAANITGLRLVKEVEPAVPLSISVGALEIPVITKSGSFGNRETLAHCVKVLRGLKLK